MLLGNPSSMVAVPSSTSAHICHESNARSGRRSLATASEICCTLALDRYALQIDNASCHTMLASSNCRALLTELLLRESQWGPRSWYSLRKSQPVWHLSVLVMQPCDATCGGQWEVVMVSEHKRVRNVTSMTGKGFIPTHLSWHSSSA